MLETAAGVEALSTAASAALPAATAAATQRVVRELRRICCPFSPGSGRASNGVSENVSGNGYHVSTAKVKASPAKCAEIPAEEFRNVPEHASMTPWPRPLTSD